MADKISPSIGVVFEKHTRARNFKWKDDNKRNFGHNNTVEHNTNQTKTKRPRCRRDEKQKQKQINERTLLNLFQ